MAEQVPQDYLKSRPAKLNGDPVVTYPYNTSHKRVERYYAIRRTPNSDLPAFEATAPSPHQTAILVDRSNLGGDHVDLFIYEVYEDLPGPELVSSRYDSDGGIIMEKRQAVLADAANVPTAVGATTVRYESRGNSALVSLKITTITALDGRVRSTPARVRVDLPRVLAGVMVTYQVSRGEGDDTGNGGSVSLPDVGTYSVTAHSSSRASSSLTIIPEIWAPLRELDGENVPAVVKEVFLSGALSEAGILAKLASMFEVVVTGSLTPNATGTFPGNSSDAADTVWFSQGSYKLLYDGTTWKLGTAAGILAGNYWSRTAAATAWLGTYTAVGTVTGTATVAAGRTINAWPRWGKREVVLTTAGKQVAVSTNSSASQSISRNSDGGVSKALSTGSGASVSTGGNQARVTIPPTLHASITIAKPDYTAVINATSAAVLPGVTGPWTSAGTDSSSPQTTTSYVRALGGTVIPATVPAAPPTSGLYLHPNFSVSRFDAVNTKVMGAVIDMSYFAEAPLLSYSDLSPVVEQSVAMIPNQPIQLAGEPTSYSISPSLPIGLSLNTSTGVISGTTIALPQVNVPYTITATNAQGSATCIILLTITT